MFKHIEFPGLGVAVTPSSSLVILSILSLTLGILIHLLPPHQKRRMIPTQRKSCAMPPGPKGWPLVGTLIPWLRARNGGNMVSWLTTQSQHGEMTTLPMGTKTWVLLNTSRAVHEVLSKHASLTHERPYFPIAGGLVSRNRRFFLHKTADWRDGRRLVHRLLMGPASTGTGNSTTGTSSHASIIERNSLALLTSYFDDPTKWYQHHYRYALSIIYEIVTGSPIVGKSTRELDTLQLVTSTFLTSINSGFVDFFPQLATSAVIPRWVQSWLWGRHWEGLGEFHFGVMRGWWEGIKGVIDGDGDGEEEGGVGFVRDVLGSEYVRRTPSTAVLAASASAEGKDSKRGGMNLAEERGMYLVMFVLSAGADNPRMTLNAFVMACLTYTGVMQRAREDLDSLCGSGPDWTELRLPGLNDLPRLPYICAIIKEVLRWRPTVPLVPQRVLVEDMELDVGDGNRYRFLEGTEFLVNTIPVCRAGYSRPEEFWPERWLEGYDANLNDQRGGGGDGSGVEQDLWQFAFSAGRRSCSGYKLAQKELFIAVARLLYCFDFSPGDGWKVDDTKLNAFAPGEPFPVRVSVRSEAHERLIREVGKGF